MNILDFLHIYHRYFNADNSYLKSCNPLVFIFIFVLVTTLTVPFHTCFAHIVDSKIIQVWKNPDDNLQIQFGYMPEKPIIDISNKTNRAILSSMALLRLRHRIK